MFEISFYNQTDRHNYMLKKYDDLTGEITKIGNTRGRQHTRTNNSQRNVVRGDYREGSEAERSDDESEAGATGGNVNLLNCRRPLGDDTRYIIGTNLLTKFHEDWKIEEKCPPPGSHFHEDRTVNVASRVKNAPPRGSHVFQANIIIFELIQAIIKTNLLTKFHEDWK
ncbi:hypothetical protein DPMN_057032 [Dreissena polymorpha]|uniref:Uncharacterized protein n=1 Tax=Dreissena polymorpha TaxID=45954 RepID=A0A9D4CTN7_DREPO|nr:hypothetical protein DPMN_057032 [Dreissena polymorpha]